MLFCDDLRHSCVCFSLLVCCLHLFLPRLKILARSVAAILIILEYLITAMQRSSFRGEAYTIQIQYHLMKCNKIIIDLLSPICRHYHR